MWWQSCVFINSFASPAYVNFDCSCGQLKCKINDFYVGDTKLGSWRLWIEKRSTESARLSKRVHRNILIFDIILRGKALTFASDLADEREMGILSFKHIHGLY